MPRTPQKGTAVRIDGDHHKILRKLVKRSGKTQGEIFELLLEITDENDLLNPEWDTRLTASLERGKWIIQWKNWSESNDDCEGLRGVDQKWKCIQGRKNKTPMIRLLGADYDEARNLCEGCEITKARTAETEGLREKVITLQAKLRHRADIVYRVPVCEAVGILNSDSTLFSRCQEYNMRAVNIEKFCKIKNNGDPCGWYKESIVGVGEEIK